MLLSLIIAFIIVFAFIYWQADKIQDLEDKMKELQADYNVIDREMTNNKAPLIIVK